MSEMMTRLPIVSLAGLGSPEADARIALELDQAFSSIGFCYFVDTGLDPALRRAVFDASRQFHEQPAAAKQKIAMNEFHRGYMAPNTSLLETSSVAKVTRPNYSESFMFMHEVAPDDPRWGEPLQGPTPWPEKLPGFREAVLAYHGAMDGFCRRLLGPLARALSLDSLWFNAHFAQPTEFLRLLHYPPQPPDADDQSFGSAPHTDYGFITILAQDNSGGLEVRRKDGGWIAAPPIADSFVVNVGDMLARWTNGRWQSTPHRVRNVSGGDRFSCPYFFDMSMESVVECLPTCRNDSLPPLFEPVRYGDYLLERLNRNYAYRKKAS